MSVMTNQYPDFEFHPDLSDFALKRSLHRLLHSGSIMDSALERSCQRLSASYRLLCSSSPEPLWAPRLQITPELRRQSELYLPLAAIIPAIRRLIRLACRYEPFLTALPQSFNLSWYDALSALRPLPVSADPGELIRNLAADEILRQTVLFSLLNPVRYGGGFGRYSGQMEFIAAWLKKRLNSGGSSLHLLDAACGSGEQCYELAALLQKSGSSGKAAIIHGVTVEPLELVTAAHGWFPHDKERQANFHHKVKPLLDMGYGRMIRFVAADIENPEWSGESYDLIVCNGLIGGPMLHEKSRIAQVLRSLGGRLKKKGVLLLADRFHDGWRRKTPNSTFTNLLADAGLVSIECTDGQAAVKP
jgi:chemotaxis methyl-accepting protein methylase